MKFIKKGLKKLSEVSKKLTLHQCGSELDGARERARFDQSVAVESSNNRTTAYFVNYSYDKQKVIGMNGVQFRL